MYSEVKKYCDFDEELLVVCLTKYFLIPIIIMYRLQNATTQMGECISNLNWNMTVCTLYQSQIPDCIEPYLKFFESCMKGSGSDLPRFIKDVVVAITKYMCSISGESVMGELKRIFVNLIVGLIIPRFFRVL